ncbi:MAG: hypothetical protein PUE44_09450 [Bulleidia sp.]|nr:hypothetical protein [Bulleidia sp.]
MPGIHAVQIRNPAVPSGYENTKICRMKVVMLTSRMDEHIIVFVSIILGTIS